ncbi:GNAT family N-acetyltransferase [Roseococcus sp. YIM B11640]|uniref:GNAT family N-acetyltransferase n=1 Tax=Roseococcus sp. YIM B11640 TaxID=3133973 RepID=UPI003C7A64CC
MKPVAVQPGEEELLAEIHEAAFAADSAAGRAWSAPAFRTLLAMPGVYGLRTEDKGFILMRHVMGEAEVLTLAVRPGDRRQGLGGTLLAEALAFAAAAGVTEVFLEVAEANQPAVALYTLAGFVRIGRRPNYYGPGQDAGVLRFAL